MVSDQVFPRSLVRINQRSKVYASLIRVFTDRSADPGARDPGARDPGARDPGARDPGARDPGAKDPGVLVGSVRVRVGTKFGFGSGLPCDAQPWL